MKNRLKGVTLIETMLYIGLFSIIILIVLNFMLSTQEGTLRTARKSHVYQSAQFVTQHINYSFNKTLGINTENSTFGNNSGILELVFTDSNKQYSVSDYTLYFDGVALTPRHISITSFSLNPIYSGETLIGIQSTIEFVSKDDSKISETINLLSIVR